MQVAFEFYGAGILAAIVLGVGTSTAWEKGWPRALSSGVQSLWRSARANLLVRAREHIGHAVQAQADGYAPKGYYEAQHRWPA